MRFSFNAIDAYIDSKITERLVPGAVLLISHQGRIMHEAAYGAAQLYNLNQQAFQLNTQSYPAKIAAGIRPLSTSPRMDVQQVFDLASLTKALATSFAIMLLMDSGDIILDNPLKQYLPVFDTAGKRDITLRQLMHHRAGFIPWVPLYYHADNPIDAIACIAAQPLLYPPDTQCIYSDLSFITLGYLVEKISRSSLDGFLKKHLFHPLNLFSISFNPATNKDNFAATSHGNPHEYNLVASNKFASQNPENVMQFTKWRTYTLIGEVNDGNAFHAFNGMAGHAGLFATAREVNTLLELINNRGFFNLVPIINSRTIDQLIHSCTLDFCLGWKILNRELNSILAHTDFATQKIIGHTGFTGTLAVCIPEKQFNLILLTNRQNLGLNNNGTYNDLTEFRKEVLHLALTIDI